jgi:drug/metabolite transporter (DMT)-like permease
MTWHLISLPLIAIGVIVYHLSQKSIPKEANPFLALTVAYALATAICLLALVTNSDSRKWDELAQGQQWLPVIFLGLSAVGIELGFLYAYRTGWGISTTAITTVPFVTVVLAIIGVLWFKEELSALNIIGMGLCVAGVICVNIK